jgi:hypothetical protein
MSRAGYFYGVVRPKPNRQAAGFVRAAVIL